MHLQLIMAILSQPHDRPCHSTLSLISICLVRPHDTGMATINMLRTNCDELGSRGLNEQQCCGASQQHTGAKKIGTTV